MVKITIYFPDVSNYQAGLTLEANTVAVVAKATNGTGGVDASFSSFKSQAAAAGAIFSGYHFLEAGNGAAQAQNYFNVAGSVACMIDCEQDGSSNPTVQDCVDFRNELVALGGRVWAVYLPNWYWNSIGSPDLSPLSGVALVASDYNPYSDTSSGWNTYGNMSPSVLQFSDTFSYGGMQIDFNAFKGTTDQLNTLVNGAPAPSPNPVESDPINMTMSTPSVNGVAGLSWSEGSTKNVQVITYSGLGPAPQLEFDFINAGQGPVEIGNDNWSNNRIVIPMSSVAASDKCCGVIVRATTNQSTPFWLYSNGS